MSIMIGIKDFPDKNLAETIATELEQGSFSQTNAFLEIYRGETVGWVIAAISAAANRTCAFQVSGSTEGDVTGKAIVPANGYGELSFKSLGRSSDDCFWTGSVDVEHILPSEDRLVIQRKLEQLMDVVDVHSLELEEVIN